MSAFSALSGPVPCVSPSFPFSTFPSTKNGSPPPRWQEEGSGTSERILPGWLLAPVSTKHTEGEKREDRPLPQPRLQLRRMHAFYVLERATLEYHLMLTEGDLTFTPTVEDPMVFMVTKHTSVFSNHDGKGGQNLGCSLNNTVTQGWSTLVTPRRYYMDSSAWQRTYRILCSLEKE